MLAGWPTEPHGGYNVHVARLFGSRPNSCSLLRFPCPAPVASRLGKAQPGEEQVVTTASLSSEVRSVIDSAGSCSSNSTKVMCTIVYRRGGTPSLLLLSHRLGDEVRFVTICLVCTYSRHIENRYRPALEEYFRHGGPTSFMVDSILPFNTPDLRGPRGTPG